MHHLYHDNRSGNWENYFCNQQQKKADRSKPNYEIRAWFQDARKTFREEITSILDIFFQNFTAVRGYGSFN